jgi:hypothetical protein
MLRRGSPARSSPESGKSAVARRDKLSWKYVFEDVRRSLLIIALCCPPVKKFYAKCACTKLALVTITRLNVPSDVPDRAAVGDDETQIQNRNLDHLKSDGWM